MAHDGNTLGKQVSELEKWLGRKAANGDTYSAQSNWIKWDVEDKTRKFGSKKLPAYVPLNENCHAIVTVVKEGWLPERDVEWVKSWTIEFDSDVDDREGLEAFLKSVCGKPSKSVSNFDYNYGAYTN